MIGSVRPLEGQFAGVTSQFNADDCAVLSELHIKACIDGLLWSLKRAHGTSTNLEHVMQQVLFSEGDEVVIHAASSPSGPAVASDALAIMTGLIAAVRPLTVQSAQVIRYQIQAILHMTGAGPEADASLAEAKSRLAAWINPRKRLGVEVARSGVDAQLHVAGVSRVELVGWQDLSPTKAQAAFCTGYTVTLAG